MSRTELTSLGEFGLIKHITEHFPVRRGSTILGPGDDAAIIKTPQSKLTVLTTDLLIEGVHFDLAYVPLKHLGYKAVVVNLSDVFAMNAKPEQITVSIAVSNRFSLEAVEELYAGIQMACERYDVDLIGGDTSSSLSGLMISITALGYVEPEKVVKRSGAGASDLLVVSGDLGSAFLGLQILEREKQVFMSTTGTQPQLENYEYILERQLKPEARKDIIDLLEKLEVVPTSMIDISDGLASEVLHLADQSEKNFVVYEEKLPFAPEAQRTAEELGLDMTTCILNGGEEYELLFTVKQSDYDRIKGNPNFTIIGHVSEDISSSVLVTRLGQSIALNAQGWDAFMKK
jgi:thiamine-monophosphate kinase